MCLGIFLIFAQNIDRGYMLEPPRLCFGAKIRKIGIPLYTQFYYIKVGIWGYVLYTWTCFLMFTMYIKLDDLKQPFISIQVNTIQLLTIESLNMM